MATKRIKNAGTYEYEITQSTKNDVYVFSNETVAAGTQINFTCDPDAETIFARSGDDLVLAAAFGDLSDITNTTVKYVIIKDYYKYTSEDKQDLVSLNGSSAYGMSPSAFVDVDDINITESWMAIGSTKSSTYNISDNSGFLIDAGGNDSYKMTSASCTIKELAGNESYDITDTGCLIDDAKGNDNYKLTYGSMTFNDYAGKDSYDINNAGGSITDYKGNDKYTIEQFSGIIEDFSGKDVYKINNLNSCRIIDGVDGEKSGGNDKFTVTNVTGQARLEDYYGNESYDLSDINSVSIYEGAGNDKYTLKNVLATGSYYSNIQDIKGNDKYSFDNVSKLMIDDTLGKDKYDLKNVANVRINDRGGGSDKYNVSDSSYVQLYDIPGEGDSGNDTYTLNNVDNTEMGTNLSINDISGKDKYSINNSDNIRIQDVAGNDKYNIKNTNNLSINDVDNGSNDTYYLENIDNSGAPSYQIFDVGGNDKFTVKNSKSLHLYAVGNGKKSFKVSDSEHIYIENHESDKLKNTYDISNSTSVKISNTDSSNDVYNLKNVDNSENMTTSGYWFFDQGGDDKFNIKNCESIYLETVEKGQKTYNVSKSNHVYLESHEYDNKGDTYNISEVNSLKIWNTDNSNDVYKLNKVNNSENVAQYYIQDHHGDDKYTIKNSSGIRLYDYYGKDTYNISNVNELTIFDGDKLNLEENDDYTDTYNIKNSTNIVILDYSLTSNDIYTFTNVKNDSGDAVCDYGGDDTYTISKSSEIGIYDKGTGNDTYTFDSLKTQYGICDCGGSNDTLKFSGMKTNNVICMADFLTKENYTATGDVYSTSLILFDKTQKDGGIIIANYFELDEDGIFIDPTTRGAGCIENIYAGKKEISGMVQDYVTGTDYNEIAESIASWLQTNDLYCVSDLFEDGNEAKLSEFITYVADNNLY